MDRNTDLTVALAIAKAAPKRKPKLSPVEFAKRFAREQVLQQQRYCDAFALWRGCARSEWRRRHACAGDRNACLRRALPRVPHPVQWRARQDILKATPANIGAPERKARQCMPQDFYE
jgi:hypothetical protein